MLARLLANAPYETLTDGFREDFVEAPPEMLANVPQRYEPPA